MATHTPDRDFVDIAVSSLMKVTTRKKCRLGRFRLGWLAWAAETSL